MNSEGAMDVRSGPDPDPWRPPSPKLAGARTGWYRYYAGYSRDFVREVLDHLRLETGATILDPWNGSGTTTAVANEAGYGVAGFDANPALVLVALGRQLDVGTAPSLSALTNDLIKHAKGDMRAKGQRIAGPAEPLTAWFEPRTAVRLRALERAIQRILIDEEEPRPFADRGLDGVSTLAAFFYVALFEITRSLVTPFRTSNPTWVKSGGTSTNLISGSWAVLEKAFRDAVRHLKPGPGSIAPDLPRTLGVANSLNIPLTAGSVDATVTSPPYCTRIDYIMATLPELAILGYDGQQVRNLRDAMVGTPTMWAESAKGDEAWGTDATSLLEKVAKHPSRASATYYLKYFTQYFQSMWQSLGEIGRVSKTGAPLVLVVQDSYYKEIHVDLPAILLQMVCSRGWTQIERVDYLTQITKAAIHPGARKYRTSFGAVESVLVCRS